MDLPLRQGFCSAREKWPTFALPTLEQFSDHVRTLKMAPEDLERHATDVFLALACGLRLEPAVAYLEANLLPRITLQLIKTRLQECERRDAVQQLLLYLLTGDHPRILNYAGKATLISWLSVIVVRSALQMKRRQDQARPRESERVMDQLISREASPEMRLAIEDGRYLLQQALSKAIESLPDRDRTVLRLSFVDGLAIDGIGELYGVHRATAARWIANSRQRILKAIESSLRVDHGVGTSELRSLIAIAKGELHVSLVRVLGVN